MSHPFKGYYKHNHNERVGILSGHDPLGNFCEEWEAVVLWMPSCTWETRPISDWMDVLTKISEDEARTHLEHLYSSLRIADRLLWSAAAMEDFATELGEAAGKAYTARHDDEATVLRDIATRVANKGKAHRAKHQGTKRGQEDAREEYFGIATTNPDLQGVPCTRAENDKSFYEYLKAQKSRPRSTIR